MWCSTVGVMVTLTLSILTAPLVTAAQPAGKVYRIGWLSSGSLRPDVYPLSMPSGRGCVNSAMSRARTSSLNTVGRRGAKSGFGTWQPSSSD